MVYEFLGLLVESYGTWLLLQRLVDASKDSDIPKNVPFAFAINNRNTEADRVKNDVAGWLLMETVYATTSWSA
jgi:hypothetical protein